MTQGRIIYRYNNYGSTQNVEFDETWEQDEN
jgi:hypothetical protein